MNPESTQPGAKFSPFPRGTNGEGAGGRGAPPVHVVSSTRTTHGSTSPRFFWGRCEPRRAEGAPRRSAATLHSTRVSFDLPICSMYIHTINKNHQE